MAPKHGVRARKHIATTEHTQLLDTLKRQRDAAKATVKEIMTKKKNAAKAHSRLMKKAGLLTAQQLLDVAQMKCDLPRLMCADCRQANDLHLMLRGGQGSVPAAITALPTPPAVNPLDDAADSHSAHSDRVEESPEEPVR
jgi:hypothetical protein